MSKPTIEEILAPKPQARPRIYAYSIAETDVDAAPVRVTYDADLLVEFVRLGFQRDMTAEAPICCWRYNDLAVDLMPTDPGILGFANRW